ncbi:MAG: hypothetical protein ACRDYA_05365 [Egibacteraceae bacterium]
MSGAFLGVLVAFLVWSVQWALEDRRQVTFDMPGEVTTLELYEGNQEIDAADAHAAGQELRRYLTDQGISLIVASSGDGSPQMTVFDPARRLSWFTPAADETGSAAGIYLFEGSYSALRWIASSVTPLLPEGTTVAGVVAPPTDVGDLQYVMPLAEVFPPGAYVLGGASSADATQLQSLLRRQGLEAQSAMQIPLVAYLLNDPPVVATALFLLLGYVCAAAYWSLLLGGRTRELVIRRRHGARLSTLVRRWFASGLPAMLLGLIAGVSVSGVVVRGVGREPLTGAQYVTLAQAAGVGLFATSLVWLATVAAGLYARDRVRRAA